MPRNIAAALLLLSVIAGCGKPDSSSSSSSSSSSQKTPEEAWKGMKDAFLAKDARALLNTLSAKSRKDLVETVGKENVEKLKTASPEDLKKVAENLETTDRDLKNANAEEFVLLVLKHMMNDPEERKKLEGTKWKESRIGGDKAVAVTIKPDGSEEKEGLVKEDGTWKVDKEETDRLKAGGAENLPVSEASSSSSASQKTPEQAWRAMVEVIRAKDNRALWKCISRKSQKALTEGDGAKNIETLKAMPDDQLTQVIAEWMVSVPDLRKLSNEEIIIASLNGVLRDDKAREEALGSKWKEVKIEGDKAVATTIKPDGKEEKSVLVKEDGTWKMDTEETDKLKE
ncbi:MAG: hypothetical protein K8T20_04830 [Planctomycetes bacterium]|nr:hypothetical protein [Planctomycetota bacterium]